MLVCLAAAGTVGPLTGQSVRVTVPEENFRKDPRVTASNRLATVFEGAVLTVEDRQGRWERSVLEGWIWTPSVSSTDRDGFDLVVSNPGGENLRESPAGDARRVARLLRGMLLDRVEQQGGWTRVRRTAWLWAESTIDVEREGDELRIATPVRVDSAVTSGPAELPDRIAVTEGGGRLHVSPDGDTLAVVNEGADLEVLARRGSWARVRLEGWVWVPATIPADSAAPGDLTPADVSSNPEQYRGRRVQWRLQFVSLESAEPTRTDFYEGEPFMLVRATTGEQGFVYVAVPPELLVDVERLQPLETVEVMGRVRTGRSTLMGVPVLDLIALH
jgi:hypothetical protein